MSDTTTETTKPKRKSRAKPKLTAFEARAEEVRRHFREHKERSEAQNDPSGQEAQSTHATQEAANNDAQQTTTPGLEGHISAVPEPEIIERTQDHDEIKRRIDGSLKIEKLSPQLKAAIAESYEDNLGLDTKTLSKALGVGHGTLCKALREYPATLARARQNRQATIIENVEAGLLAMSERFRESAASGAIDPNSKNLSAWGVLFGIMTDKRQLMTGSATSRSEVLTGTFEDRKKAMIAVLDRAQSTMKMLETANAGKGSSR